MRSLADELDDAEEEVTGQAQIHVNGGTVVVEQTGKFKALEEPTKPDNPKPDSGPPKAARGIVTIVQAVDTWPKAFALAVVAALIGFAIWKGVALP